jgi:dTDP-glucose 4,6-dehydratase
MATLLITGGAGFIGSNLIRRVISHTTHRIVIVDKLTYAGSLANLEGPLTDQRVTFVHADIADRPAMKRVFDEHRPDAVVNLAAETHVDRSIDGPRPFIDTNIIGTFVLLEISRQLVEESRPVGFRFLHVSTDEVYGTLGASGLFGEETAYAPNSPYAASKASADHLVRAYYHTYGLPTLITNCSNNYGPFQYPEKLIPLMILNALDGKPLPIYGDGGNVRDWIHVEDHCAGILLVLAEGRAGERYNIGGGNERTNLQIVDGICDALQEIQPPTSNPALSRRQSYRDLKMFVPDRPGHDRRYAIDASKIRQELGWTPAYDFESGLARTIRWYFHHRDWCRTVLAGKYQGERLGLSASQE